MGILECDTMECSLGKKEPRDVLIGPVLEVDRPVSCSDIKPVISFLNEKINRQNKVFLNILIARLSCYLKIPGKLILKIWSCSWHFPFKREFLSNSDKYNEVYIAFILKFDLFL